MPLYTPNPTFAWNPRDRGLLAENVPADLCAGTVMSTAGRLEGAAVRLPTVASVTNLVVVVTTAGNTLTSGQCFGALYDSAGVLIGQTADQAAAWVSTGVKTMALGGGPFTLQAGIYNAVAWFNGTTGPALGRGGSGLAALANHGFSAPNLKFYVADTGKTTTAPTPLGAQTGTANAWYFALT